jgi:hypothetical protein
MCWPASGHLFFQNKQISKFNDFFVLFRLLLRPNFATTSFGEAVFSKKRNLAPSIGNFAAGGPLLSFCRVFIRCIQKF